MRKRLPVALAVLSGLFALTAIFLKTELRGFLALLLNWAILISSAALLVALATLLLAYIRRIVRARNGLTYSLVLVSGFLAAFVGGILLGVDNPDYLTWIAAVQMPLEISLLGLAALVMTSMAVQVFRSRGWSPLTVSFAISALVFLVTSLNVLQALNIPQLDIAIAYLQQLPLIGARGLLIGIGIGALVMSLRVLIGLESRYGE